MRSVISSPERVEFDNQQPIAQRSNRRIVAVFAAYDRRGAESTLRNRGMEEICGTNTRMASAARIDDNRPGRDSFEWVKRLIYQNISR
jgi:hypothetical protein